MHTIGGRHVRLTVVVAALAVVMLAPSSALGAKAEQFIAPLSGDQVVPGPGDPDGGGGVSIALGQKTGTFCFFSDTANISTPLTSVELHRGLRGDVGEVLVRLHGPSTDPDVSGCFDLDRALVRDISKHRASYYLDIHNEEFPGGALRAQLG